MPNTEQSIEQTGGVPEIEMEVEVFGMAMYPTDKTLSIENMPADAKKTGDAIRDANDDIAEVLLDVKALQEETGEDIPLNSLEDSPTIAEAVGDMMGNIYPVGAVFVTAAGELPSLIAALGTWVEIALPLKHGDKLNGTRSYTEVGTGFTPGNLRFFLRTE